MRDIKAILAINKTLLSPDRLFGTPQPRAPAQHRARALWALAEKQALAIGLTTADVRAMALDHFDAQCNRACPTRETQT